MKVEVFVTCVTYSTVKYKARVVLYQVSDRGISFYLNRPYMYRYIIHVCARIEMHTPMYIRIWWNRHRQVLRAFPSLHHRLRAELGTPACT